MGRLARVLVIVLLAAFAAGTVVHAAVVTSMSVKMALADPSSADMADCQGCSGDDGEAPVCDLDCVTPLVASITDGALGHAALVSDIAVALDRIISGRTGPPDPHPPRTIVLS